MEDPWAAVGHRSQPVARAGPLAGARKVTESGAELLAVQWTVSTASHRRPRAGRPSRRRPCRGSRRRRGRADVTAVRRWPSRWTSRHGHERGMTAYGDGRRRPARAAHSIDFPDIGCFWPDVATHVACRDRVVTARGHPSARALRDERAPSVPCRRAGCLRPHFQGLRRRCWRAVLARQDPFKSDSGAGATGSRRSQGTHMKAGDICHRAGCAIAVSNETAPPRRGRDPAAAGNPVPEV